jgi:hypothetical protein
LMIGSFQVLDNLTMRIMSILQMPWWDSLIAMVLLNLLGILIAFFG